MLTQLRDYLPADSNIIRFQRRFEVEPLPGTVTVAVRRTRHQLAALKRRTCRTHGDLAGTGVS
ncbi:hypothetical protein [Micromonospora profundi]|uniref:hypothetical protein n=1 Tax=Micromonospora profundi TaxID=1420889 RepID=UPI00143C01E1